LRTPGYYNKTMGPKFIAKVEEVKKLLTDADGYYSSGQYDLAFKKYEQVLALDPYNTAARRGEEKLDNIKYKYSEEAYNETRGRQLWQVEKGWEQPVRQYGVTIGPFGEAASGKRLILFGSRRRLMILPSRAKRASISFCALCRWDRLLPHPYRLRPGRRPRRQAVGPKPLLRPELRLFPRRWLLHRR